MDKEARIAFIQTQNTCALAEIEGMKAANKERENMGANPMYSPSDFNDVCNRYCIGHNAVIEYLRDY